MTGVKRQGVKFINLHNSHGHNHLRGSASLGSSGILTEMRIFRRHQRKALNGNELCCYLVCLESASASIFENQSCTSRAPAAEGPEMSAIFAHVSRPPAAWKPLLLCWAALGALPLTGMGAEEFVVWSSAADFKPPQIVIQFDGEKGTGVDWKLAENRPWYENSEAARVGAAVEFLREGLERLCGKRLEVANAKDLSRGIVLTTLAGASDEIRKDGAIIAALKNDGSDAYNHVEAYYIRSDKDRVLVVANTVDGLVVAMPDLLGSVGYEVLAMGPNWSFVPKSPKESLVAGLASETPYTQRLALNLERSGRPSYYIRALTPTSGQQYGVGTVLEKKLLIDPADETVDASYRRWQIGQRMRTQSMPGFPGHSLQAHHRAVIDHIRKTGNTEGFLGAVKLGLNADRPAASDATRGLMWINTDPAENAAAGKVFRSDGKQWTEADINETGVNLDLSVASVRQIIFEDFKAKSEAFFTATPDGLFVYGTEPEDGGGYAELATLLKNPNWYPDYLRSIDSEFGRPYPLHGEKWLDQPRELWDATAPADIVFGFNNWLLREYDRWLETQPAEQRVTKTGKPKKGAVRCSLYSYNFHDVPPNFNLDERIRVMVASYPKNRGRGKWKRFASQTDLAQAFAVMLPREPSGDYWIISLSYYWDRTMEGLTPAWDASPKFLTARQHEHYAAGFRALNMETDFNFGRFGLGYYLISQQLWNVTLTADELDAIRNRWIQRAYGSGWPKMREYYDYMLLPNYPVNSPQAWSHAIRLIEAADELIDENREPMAQRRLDDLKQYWYLYYLIDTKQDVASSEPMRELLWKGQMSYANASHMISRTIFRKEFAIEAVGDLPKGPAHFTSAETAAWWKKVLDHWPVVPVTKFAEATLADGRPAREADLNDLVAVKEFGDAPCPQALLYNAGYQTAPTFLCYASVPGEEIGFQLYWPADPTGKDGYYIARDVPYGVSAWNPEKKVREPLVDKSLTRRPSVEVQLPDQKGKHHLVAVRFKTQRAGTYRFEIDRGGNLAYLTDLGFDPTTGKHTGGRSLTFDCNAEGLTQSPSYFYIPKGTKSLDLEVWDSHGGKTLTLYKALTRSPENVSRKIDVSQRQTHRIELKPEETGVIAEYYTNGFAFPYLYSVPMLWAKSPGQLLVPRAVASADGLTVK
jgi:hypothetical protein